MGFGQSNGYRIGDPWASSSVQEDLVALNFGGVWFLMVVKFIKKKTNPLPKKKAKTNKSIQETQVKVSRTWQMPGIVWPFCQVVDGDLCSHCTSFHLCLRWV